MAVTRRQFVGRASLATVLFAFVPTWLRPRAQNGWVEREVTAIGVGKDDVRRYVLGFTRPYPTRQGTYTGRRFRLTGPNGMEVVADVPEGGKMSDTLAGLAKHLPPDDFGNGVIPYDLDYRGAFLIGAWYERYRTD